MSTIAVNKDFILLLWLWALSPILTVCDRPEAIQGNSSYILRPAVWIHGFFHPRGFFIVLYHGEEQRHSAAGHIQKEITYEGAVKSILRSFISCVYYPNSFAEDVKFGMQTKRSSAALGQDGVWGQRNL